MSKIKEQIREKRYTNKENEEIIVRLSKNQND